MDLSHGIAQFHKSRISANQIAEDLWGKLNGEGTGISAGQYELLCFDMIPFNQNPFSSQELTDKDQSADARYVKKFTSVIDALPAYSCIFKGNSVHSALSDVVEGIIAGFGPAGRKGFIVNRDANGGLPVRDLEKYTYGDLGGCMLFKPKCSEARRELLERHWLGMKKKHLEKCAQRARDGKKEGHGVYAIALGAERAQVVFAAILRQDEPEAKNKKPLFNYLLCDESLANALIALIDAYLGEKDRQELLAFLE